MIHHNSSGPPILKLPPWHLGCIDRDAQPVQVWREECWRMGWSFGNDGGEVDVDVDVEVKERFWRSE